MIYDKSQTIDAFLSETAARQPTPGGGSVTGVAGALAAAMGEMVLNYSLKKKELAEHQTDLHLAAQELKRARAALLQLMVEDQAAYEALTAIRKTAASESDRDAKLQAALQRCIQIPEEIGATAGAVLHICQRVVDACNKHLLSDLAVCAELAMATVRCASYNVRANLADLPDAEERARLESAATKQIVDCGDVIRNVIVRIWARQGLK